MAIVEKYERIGVNGRRTVTWRVRYRDPSGRQRARTFRRKADADDYAASVHMDVRRGEWVDPQHGRMPYGDWLEQWLRTTPDRRPSTCARNESLLANHVLPRFGDWQLAAITQMEVRAWVATLSASGLAPATVRECYGLFGRSLRAAVAAGLIPRSPCHDVPLPKVDPKELRILRPGEVTRVADAIHPRYRALVLLKAYGGLRIGELAGLKRGRMDLLRGSVEVAEVLVEVEGRLHTGPPKTRAGRRTVGLPRAVVEELVMHLAAWGGDEYVFTSPEGGPLRVPNWRRRFWRPAVGAAGLEPLSPHDLRHTAVSLWIAAGANPKEVARRAGHTSVAFTLDRYGHLFPGYDEQLRDRLDEMFQAGAHEDERRGQVRHLDLERRRRPS